jgi:hypothetical protein
LSSTSLEELEVLYRAAREVTEARHFQAIWLLAQGRTFLEAGEVLAFVLRWVEELAARYNAAGPAPLGDQRRRNGRAASLLREDVPAALDVGPETVAAVVQKLAAATPPWH